MIITHKKKRNDKSLTMICRVCDMPGYACNIRDDLSDNEFGTCGECEEEEKEVFKTQCVICEAQTSNELDYDYDDDSGFHCCQRTDCLRQFHRGE